jgi:hypothetical protein
MFNLPRMFMFMFIFFILFFFIYFFLPLEQINALHSQGGYYSPYYTQPSTITVPAPVYTTPAVPAYTSPASESYIQ